MQKLAIIGGNGMLGYDLSRQAEKSGYSVKIFDLPEYDITNKDHLASIVGFADLIVNCAAYTNVDNAETEVEKCYKINADAPESLGKLLSGTDKYLVHVSTDFVFGDNSTKALTETDNTNPLSVYGESKLKGENLLFDTGANISVIRVQWTYGINNDNFISKIIKLASSLDSIKVVEDQIGSPTHTEQVAKAIIVLLGKKIRGLFHFAADGYGSRYEVAKYIAEELNIDVNIKPCSSSEFTTPAQRPENSRFDCSKIDKILNFNRLNWKESLCKYLHKL
ncbi:MAG TPA: dTDP-4-dehydrorhamnose reductase [Victivallales bacterium]|nr:dTDP-4-dehydrorhamnose reductase [Victivallales bacterium]